MACSIDVISIGTLSANPFWGERSQVRAAHATTVLLREGDSAILVDPSLPAEVLAQRLHERTGMRLEQINTVFLTTFRPVHRRALSALGHARWLMSEAERSSVIASLSAALDQLDGGRSVGVSEPEEVSDELNLARRTKPAPEKLSASVHLFPSPGASVGSCALLVVGVKNVVISGDAVLTRDHLDHGRVFERAADADRARESFQDILEIADIIIPGHDNLCLIS